MDSLKELNDWMVSLSPEEDEALQGQMEEAMDDWRNSEEYQELLRDLDKTWNVPVRPETWWQVLDSARGM